jgi:hypothetical protein
MSVRQNDRTTILWLGIGAALLFAVVAAVATVLSPNSGRERVAEGAGLDPVGASPGSSQDTGRVVFLGRLPNAIPESSGAAVSRRHEGVFWTHNDRGHPARLFAVGLDGALHADIEVAGAPAVDWEDISRAPCPDAAEGDCLYIADTGDNRSDRETVTILVVREPEELRRGSVRPLAAIRVRYADGPADAEAFAMVPDGDGWIVTKGQDGSARAYRIPARRFAGPGEEPALAPEAVLPIDVAPPDQRPTGAATSPDGRSIAIRTASRVYLFDPATWASPVVCAFPGLQPQSEAIDYLDGETLLVTSESDGRPAPIHRVRCP